MPSTCPPPGCLFTLHRGGEPGLRARSLAPSPGFFPPHAHREQWRTGLATTQVRTAIMGPSYTKAGSCVTSVSLFPSEKWEPATQSHARFAFVEDWVGASHC